MSNGFKQFHKYYVKNLEINEIEWDTFSWGQLFELIYDDASIQIYPDKVLKYMVNHTELKEYDRRCDGKRYFCTGFHSNGFTPKTIIGTVRGNINRLFRPFRRRIN